MPVSLGSMSVAGGLEDCPPHFPNRHQGLGFLGIPGPAIAQDTKTILGTAASATEAGWIPGVGGPLVATFICSLGTPIMDGLSLLTLWPIRKLH